MTRKKVIYKFFPIILIIIIIFSITSCKSVNKRPSGQKDNIGSKQSEQKKQPPKSLSSLENSTKKMIEDLENINKNKQNKNEKDREKKQSKESQSNEKNDEQNTKGEKQTKENTSNKTASKETQINWEVFDKNIQEMHKKWNEYEVQAKEDGTDSQLINAFKSQLNLLTEKIMGKNEYEVLVEANNLYKYFPQFLNLYKHNAPPETLEIKYYARQILIDAEKNSWENTNILLDGIKKSWATAKSRMEKPDKTLNKMIDFAIEDFIKVTNEKKLELAKLKGQILMDNIDKIK